MIMVDLNTLRQIHMDFHTPGFVSVGEQFDAKEFFDVLEDSRVNSIAFFAKCHHGYSYFDTSIGTRHPGLSFDLLGAAAVEARKRGVDLLAYFSLNVDEVIAEQHPEWVAFQADGKPVDSQILQDGSELYWRWLCPNRGRYLEDFFFPHVEECLSKHSVDGLFIDMAGYLPGSCFCEACVGRMEALGLDPHSEIDHNKFNAANMQAFTVQLKELMDKYRPGMRLEIGCYNAFGEATKAPGIISEFYVETLAYQTGWFQFPVMGRYLSNAGLPVVGVTGRFLKNWGDFGTVVPVHQLKVILGSHLSVGSSCCIGDHMHPSGKLEKAVYSVIKEAFSFIEPRQPYCCGMKRAREISIVVPEGLETSAAVASKQTGVSGGIDIWDSLYGNAKLLMEGHHQWDVLSLDMPLEDAKTLVLIHPFLDDPAIDKLQQFVESGGTLIVDASAIMVAPDVTERWYKFIGVGEASLSQHPGAYYRMTDDRLAENVPDMANYVHASSVEISGLDDSVELAKAWYPPCVRSRDAFYGHFHGPDIVEGKSSILSTRRGDGRVIVLGQPLSAAYLNTGYHAHRTVMHNLVNSTLQDKIIQTDAPSIVEITVGRKDNRTILQFVAFVADRRHRYSFESLNEPIPIRDISVHLNTDQKINRLYNPISGEELEFISDSKGISFKVSKVIDHLLLVGE
jgi:hypothetical protein